MTRSGHSLRRESAKRGEIRRPAEPPPHVHGVLALQRSLGNRATAFKAFNGQSIPNGNIWGGAARDLLVAESLKHTAKAPPSGAAHADVLI